MEFFKKYFDEVEEWNSEEVKVLCPFHSDSRPSASINTLKNLFHCWVCDIGFNEEQFIARVNNISSVDATKLLSRYEVKDKWEVSKGYLWSDELALNKVKNLGLSNDLIYDLKLGLVKEEGTQRKYLGIPVYYNNILVDVRQYNLFKYDGQPKVKSNEGANTGWVLPYDKFLTSNNTCYFFEGEKDMLIAREVGLNAYTLTGGAGAKPNDYVINAFKDKDIVICYDNDDAGINGMNTFYSKIKDIAKQVRYIKIGDVVKENKEDFYDYIKKYDGNVFEFYTLEQHYFNLEETNEDKNITIKQALKDSKLNKRLKSVVTVTSEFADPYSVPSIIEMVKLKDGGTKNDTMFEGEKRTWFLEEKNMQEMLELIEVNAKNTEILSKVRTFLGIPSKEPFVDMVCKEPRTVFKSVISDKDNDGSGVSLDIYSFEKLNVGTQYVIEYRIYPHPTKHQKLIAVANKVKPIHDNNNYSINIEKLSKFKSEGNIKERLNKLYESAKHHIAKHLDYDLWLMCDLVFNSILDFKYDEVMKGALDIFLLGDTRTGKSETTSKMTELYNFGHFLSLKTSTTVGLIGGSNKVDGSFCNTIGAIPRQHKRLVVLEEFSGARQDFIRTMTDIRSSDELRIARVSGELVVPCKLRMITISNPINDESGNPRFLETFPNGVMPLMELIKSAEDVARYDGFLLIPKVENRFNPFAFRLNGEPIPKECYEEKADWVVTRGVDNVKYEDGVESYIWEKAEELNKLFECNFPLFGTTTSKKLARFCVALASLVLNVDETYENIIVTKEIVDYTAEYLTSIYSNGAFKLNEYAEDYRSYSEYTEEDVKDLQHLYASNSTFIDFISTQNRTTRSNLISISGLDGNKFAPVFNKMVAHKFIRLNNDNVYPTNKFRKVYNLIDKSFKTDVGNKVANSVGVTFVNDL